jgi:hypothetical protein
MQRLQVIAVLPAVGLRQRARQGGAQAGLAFGPQLAVFRDPLLVLSDRGRIIAVARQAQLRPEPEELLQVFGVLGVVREAASRDERAEYVRDQLIVVLHRQPAIVNLPECIHGDMRPELLRPVAPREPRHEDAALAVDRHRPSAAVREELEADVRQQALGARRSPAELVQGHRAGKLRQHATLVLNEEAHAAHHAVRVRLKHHEPAALCRAGVLKIHGRDLAHPRPPDAVGPAQAVAHRGLVAEDVAQREGDVSELWRHVGMRLAPQLAADLFE